MIERLTYRFSAIFIALSAIGCGSALTPAQHAEREACLAAVAAEMNDRADVECPGDWDSCPARKQIMEDYATRQRGCPHAR